MTERKKFFPDKVIKTWKWQPDEADYHVPDCVDPSFFYCRSHVRKSGDLLPFRFEGQELYVCRYCGNVYEIIPETERKMADPLKTWHVLFQQPYSWDYIKSPDLLEYHFVHECEGLTAHPLLDAHGGDDRADSLELIARFFTSILREGWRGSVRFFRAFRKDITVFQEDDALILSSGKRPGVVFPGNEFCTYREEPDCLSLEVSHCWEENIFGFTLDLNEEDFEDYQGYYLIRFTFLGNGENDLPDRIRELDEHPSGREKIPYNDGDLKTNREIVRNPFGLKGFFAYDSMEYTRLVK